MVPCIKTVVTLPTKESSPSFLAFPGIRNWPLLLLIWEKRLGYRCVDCTAQGSRARVIDEGVSAQARHKTMCSPFTWL